MVSGTAGGGESLASGSAFAGGAIVVCGADAGWGGETVVGGAGAATLVSGTAWGSGGETVVSGAGSASGGDTVVSGADASGGETVVVGGGRRDSRLRHRGGFGGRDGRPGRRMPLARSQGSRRCLRGLRRLVARGGSTTETTPTSCVSSTALAYRSAGFFAIAFWMTASSAGGNSGLSSRTGGTASCSEGVHHRGLVGRANGTLPVSAS